MIGKALGPSQPGINRNLRHAYNNRYLYLMLIPAILYAVIFFYLPMGGIVIAFKKYNYVKGIFGSDWVGLKNFKFLFSSNKLWFLTRNTLMYNLAFISLGIVVQVGFAVMINEIRLRRFKRTFQSFIFLPYFISWVVVAAMIQAMLGYEYGMVNRVLDVFGISRINLYMSADPWPVLLVLVQLWKTTGYGSIVYLASITGISQELYEAASIDGANLWQRIRHITLPGLKPTIIIMFLLALGQVFRGDFGLFYQMVGNNALLLPKTDILDLFVYRALASTSDLGMASAAGFYQSVLCFVTIMTVNGIIKKVQPEYSLF
ncbi:MAG: ABC transporter permease subunit [Eubacteriales bacterium]|nr:ABC transporter permease subunit [Eubacteriales bacterium]